MLETLHAIKQNMDLLLANNENIKISLNAPSDEASILHFIKERGEIPSDYIEFLRIHNGGRYIWEDFHLIGTDDFEDVKSFIYDVTCEATNLAEQVYNINTNDTDEIRNWEIRTVQYYLPHYLIFGADLQTKIIFFNQYNKNPDGKDEVVIWDKYNGAVDSYPSFLDLLKEIEQSLR